MSYIKVKDHNNLVRDAASKAILNVDQTSLLEHRKKVAQLKQLYETSGKVNQLEAEMKDVKSSLTEILSILRGNANGSS